MSDIDPTQLRYLGVEASEAKIKRALQDPDAQICEWESSGLTYVASARLKVIVRTGAMGGDLREIHGGWYYLRRVDFEKEWREIVSLEPNFKRRPKPL